MHNIFQFNDHDRALAESYAKGTFTRSLSSWKYHANRLLHEEKDLETEIKPLYPMINDEEWDKFIAYRDTNEYMNASKKGTCGRKFREPQPRHPWLPREEAGVGRGRRKVRFGM